jgi:hypothetical protein
MLSRQSRTGRFKKLVKTAQLQVVLFLTVGVVILINSHGSFDHDWGSLVRYFVLVGQQVSVQQSP